MALLPGQFLLECQQGERQCCQYIFSPNATFLCYIQLRDQLRSLVHAGDLRPGDRIPASRELALTLGVHRTTVANAYAELESEGLIQGPRRPWHLYPRQWQWPENFTLRLRPPHNGGWPALGILFADERSEEILTRLTAECPRRRVLFRDGPSCSQEFFPVEDLQTCANAVLRREGQKS